MEEKQKVYIKGVPGRGKEVMKALTKLGGGKGWIFDGEDDDCVYFINHTGEIDHEHIYTEKAKIIMDNYRELHLPEKWEDGNILFNPQYKCFAIYEHKCTIPYFAVAYYCIAENYMTPYLPRIEINDYRLATSSEIEHFHELLHKNGKDWDAEKKQLVDWQWKPKEREIYWYISTDGLIASDVFSNDEIDNGSYDFGNCFRTEEEAKAAYERVKKALKGE